jgi:Transcription factor TFIIH complex subunit Tfb5
MAPKGGAGGKSAAGAKRKGQSGESSFKKGPEKGSQQQRSSSEPPARSGGSAASTKSSLPEPIGYLVKCSDIPTKQFILHLNDSKPVDKQFIIQHQELVGDATHLLVEIKAKDEIERKVGTYGQGNEILLQPPPCSYLERNKVSQISHGSLYWVDSVSAPQTSGWTKTFSQLSNELVKIWTCRSRKRHRTGGTLLLEASLVKQSSSPFPDQ